MTTTNVRFVAKNGLDNNSNSISNLGAAGASLALSGANALVLTTTGSTNLTLPASGTLVTTTGNVATATTLATPRAINGVNFDGSAPITVAAAAGTLTGTALASNVVSSSLTSVGTLTGLTVAGNIILNNAQYLQGKNTTGTAGRITGFNASNALYIGDIDNVGNGTINVTVSGVQPLTINSVGVAITGVTTSGGTDNAFGLSVTSATSDLQFTGYNSAVTGAVIEARRGATYKNLTLNGTTITIGSTGAGSATVSSTGLAVAGALSATGGISNTGGQLSQTATLGVGTNSLQVTGAAGAARDIAVLGQSGYSNGFTVKYNGSTMSYVFNDGPVSITGGNLAVTGALSATGALSVPSVSVGSSSFNNASLFNGLNSGVGSGASVNVQNGGAAVISIGNYSNMIGGAYDATATIYSVGALKTYISGLGIASTLDASGNLGLGVVPDSWTSYRVMNMGGHNYVYSSLSTSDELGYGQNAYYNSGWKYGVTGTLATWHTAYRGTYVWNTAPSGTAGNPITFTQAMTLDASGNLLVGLTTATSSPIAGLSINYASGNSYIATGHVSGTVSGQPYATYAYNGATIGSITQNGTTGINLDGGANLNLTGTTVTAPTVVSTDNSTNVATTAFVKSALAGVGSGVTIQDNTSATSAYYPTISSAITGSVSTLQTSSTKFTFTPSSGTLSATVVTTLSDINVKTNIVGITDAVATLSNIDGVEFNWKDTGAKSAGVIAQTVEEVLPHLVDTSETGIKSVNYSGLIGYLIEAVKSQQAQIDKLSALVNGK